MRYKIGIDSGGTHIVTKVYDEKNQLIFSDEQGPGNIVINKNETLNNLERSIDNCFQKINKVECDVILIGIAGIETSNNESEIAEIFNNKYAIKTIVISDAKLALINKLQNQDGVLIISGTGSIIYSKFNKIYRRYGGWGNVLGDEGSAYKISQVAISKALNDFDMNIKTPLQDIIINFFGVNDLFQVVQKFYKLNKGEIAKLAGFLAQNIELDQLSIKTIFQQQAELLASDTISLLKLSNNLNTPNIALSGSVLEKNNFFRTILENCIKKEFPKANFINNLENNAAAVKYLK